TVDTCRWLILGHAGPDPRRRIDAHGSRCGLRLCCKRRDSALKAFLQRDAMPIRRGISRMMMGIGLFALLSLAANVEADSVPAIMDRYATVNGVKLHYLVAGKGT